MDGSTALADPVVASKLRSPILSWQTSAPPRIPVLRQVQQPQQHRIPELCRRGRIPSERWTVRLRSPILSWPANCAHRSCRGRHLHRQGSLSEIEGAADSKSWTVRLRSPILSWPANCARRSCITFQKELLSDPLRFQ